MKKFRVISDLHLDINKKYPFEIKDDIFTVICGDTSGNPNDTINWIHKNIKSGIGCSGNHLVYNNENKTIQELREQLSNEFPLESNFTYLDTETSCFKKEIDGILFLGSCFYSNMEIKSPYCPDGNIDVNKRMSFSRMNDYKWAIKEKTSNIDKTVSIKRITPDDYIEWCHNAMKKFDEVLTENESRSNPLPVVILTHYPLISDVVRNSFYVDEDNWASYGNDMIEWMKSHTSIKCHCCGHCHDMKIKFRHFKISRDDGSQILIINNSRGYMSRNHDLTFNPNRFVNVKTWNVEEKKESKKTILDKERRYNQYLAMSSCFF